MVVLQHFQFHNSNFFYFYVSYKITYMSKIVCMQQHKKQQKKPHNHKNKI